MKASTVVGILLAVVGAFIVFRGLTYQDREDIVRVGDVRIQAETRKAIPTWIGAAAIVGGVLLVVAGSRSGRS
jgi:hypothetical protein